MPAFAYQALTHDGRRTAGTIAAPDRSAAIGSVEALGLTPLKLEAAGEVASSAPRGLAASRGTAVSAVFRKPVRDARATSTTKRVAAAHVHGFVRQLGNLLAAGVPLARALEVLTRESTSAAAAAQWRGVRAAVVDGAPLAEALGRYPRSFPPVYVAMVRAGETGGFLDVVLQQIAEFMSRARDLQSKVATALIYPAVLALIASGVVTFLLYWFIPRFSGIFADFGRDLPLLTRAVQAASLAVRDYGLFVALLIAVLVVGLRQAVRSDAGRRLRDAYVLRTPLVGGVASTFALVRFARMLGTLLGAGVPLLTALRVAREAVGNQTLDDALGEAIESVQQGGALAASLRRCPALFPASVVEMIAVAEESGRLSDELVRLANQLEQDLDRRLRVLVALAEPALLFVMAAVVGTIVVGMLLPVFDLWDAIQ